VKVKVICDYCGIQFEKSQNEYNRRIKLGKRLYCSRECSGKKFHNQKLGGYRYDNTAYLRADNRRDEFTPFRRHLKRARSRGKECTVTLEELRDQWDVQAGLCVYTRIPLVIPKDSGFNHPLRTASLDRIDSSKGYVAGNVQFVTMAANYAKANMSDEDMREFISLIIGNYYQ
jgi:hypothetical protein